MLCELRGICDRKLKKEKEEKKKKNPLELVIAKSWGDSLQTNFSDMEIPRYPFISFSFSLFYHKG